MDKYFDFFLESFGQPTSKTDVPAGVIEKFRGKLPNQLLEYWKAYGFSIFKNGLLYIVNPDDYAPDLKAWIGDTPVAKIDTFHVIARTGFGELFLWGEKTGYKYQVSALLGAVIEQRGHADMISVGKGDFAIQCFFSTKEAEECDVKDPKEKPLFENAVKELGALGSGEVFAFEPALGAGGVADMKNIKKRNVHVYLSLLAQLCERRVWDDAELSRRAFSKG